MELRIGTRGSTLALAQAEAVSRALQASHPDVRPRLVPIRTTGNGRRAQPLPTIGGKGLFTQEIEAALLDGAIHLAVHSLKDLPTDLSPGLTVAAVPPRAPANDALIARSGEPLAHLPAGARVGTGSLRRAAQLRRARADLVVGNIRGNVDTRLRKLREGRYQAIVLALAGLVRLGRRHTVTQVLPPETMLPAPGQGALAIETREDDERMVALARALADPATTAATTAERTLLHLLGGGCSLPLGAYAEPVEEDGLRLRANLLTPDGSLAATADCRGAMAAPRDLAQAAVDELRRNGAEEILRRLASESEG